MNQLTDENKAKLKLSLQTIYAFVIQQTKTDKDNEIADEIQDAFATTDLDTPVTQDALTEAIFDTAEVITGLTSKTTVDDAIVKTAHDIYNATQGKGGVAFFEAIKGLVQVGKAKKAAKAAE